MKYYAILGTILGVGPFATVHLGSWSDRDVAFKRIDAVSTEDDNTYITRENDLKKLNHTNITKLFYSLSSSEVNRYLAIELCATSLDRLFLPDYDGRKYRGPRPSDKQVLMQLSQGLSYMHANGVPHYDVNPRSVLLSASEPVVAKWSGFALGELAKRKSMRCDDRFNYYLDAVSENETTPGGNFSNFIVYWAPEIIFAAEQDVSEVDVVSLTQSDVWSCGCLFFWFLTEGMHPYGDVYNTDIFDALEEDNKINWEHLTGDLERRYWRHVLDQMMHRNPEKRISMSDVVAHLQNVPTFHGWLSKSYSGKP